MMFSAPMIRALTAGAKTETRRLAVNARAAALRPGHLVWVREAFRLESNWDGAAPNTLKETSFVEMPVWHEADCGAPSAKTRSRWDRPFGRLRNSIHMPRWASRLTLEIRAVRAEPVQAIDEDGAGAEGVRRLWDAAGEPRFGVEMAPGSWVAVAPTRRLAYAQFWDGLHSGQGERWADNPAVTVIAFRLLKMPIDAVLRERAA